MLLKFEVALEALARAESARDYRAAKLMVADLDPLSQLAMIDSVREAKRRLRAKGVL